MKAQKNKITAEVLKKSRVGSPIEDWELTIAINTLAPCVDFLGCLDDRFSLIASKLRSELDLLRSFRDARAA